MKLNEILKLGCWIGKLEIGLALEIAWIGNGVGNWIGNRISNWIGNGIGNCIGNKIGLGWKLDCKSDRELH